MTRGTSGVESYCGPLTGQIVALLSCVTRWHTARFIKSRAQQQQNPNQSTHKDMLCLEWRILQDVCQRTHVILDDVDPQGTIRNRIICGGDGLNSMTIQMATRRWEAVIRHRVARQREKFYTPQDDEKQQMWTSEAVEMLTEVKETVDAMYPDGCAAADLLTTLQTVAAMSGAAIDDDVIAQYDYLSLFLESNHSSTLSCDDIKQCFIKGPLFDKLTPSRWWERLYLEETDTKTEENMTEAITEIAIRSEPVPALRLTYRESVAAGAVEPLRQTKEIRLARFETEHCRDGEDTDLLQLARRLDPYIGHFPGMSVARLLHYLTRLRELIRAKRNKNEAARESAEQEKEAFGSSNAALKKADIGLLYRNPDAALKDVDLNDADDATLQEYKDKMSEKFDTAVLKPGDAGYKYDNRKTFTQVAKSEWDDSDDE